MVDLFSFLSEFLQSTSNEIVANLNLMNLAIYVCYNVFLFIIFRTIIDDNRETFNQKKLKEDALIKANDQSLKVKNQAFLW